MKYAYVRNVKKFFIIIQKQIPEKGDPGPYEGAGLYKISKP